MNRWYRPFPNGWFIIVLTTLQYFPCFILPIEKGSRLPSTTPAPQRLSLLLLTSQLRESKPQKDRNVKSNILNGQLLSIFVTSWGLLKCRVLSILKCKLEGINVQQCYLLKRALVHVVLAPETKYWQLMKMATCFFSGNGLPSIAMDDWKITEISWGLPCFQTKHRHAILQVEWKKTAVCIGLS